MIRFLLRAPFCVAFLAFILSITGSAQQANLPGNGMRDRTPQYISNQLLVRFRDSSTPTTAKQSQAMNLGKPVRDFTTTVPGLQLIELPTGVDFNAALASYRRDPSVLYAEPNYVRKALDGPPNDIYLHDLWSMHNIGQLILFPYPPFFGPKTATPGADIHALEAWSITTGSSDIVLGLIDTGIDVNHEDLTANIYRNQADCNNDGIDDDGNGYVDDCYGINTLDGNSDVTDLVHHGTHVAGIMGAAGNNGLGVAGVNWKAKILTCKFLGQFGGTDAGAIACFNYMAAMKDRGVNIVATNNSWGGYGYSQALYDAIDGMRKRGILVIAAAGNSISDNDGLYPLYPASFALDNIIAVAASDFTDNQSYYSNFGAHTVSISAPGDEILSTTPDNTYSVFTGTSMATPHVTGVAALLKAQDPNRDWKAIRNLILAGGDKLSTVAASITGSRLNALNSLSCQNRMVSAPLQPQSSSILATSGQALNLSLLNINCGLPAAGPVVSVTPGGQQVSLHDDGVSPDQDSSDGIFSGQFTPGQAGLYTLAFPGGQQVQVAADPYTSSSGGAFRYRSFSGTNLNLTDESYGFVPSPFPISFGGGAYPGVYAFDNGYLSFDTFLPSTPSSLPVRYAGTVIAPFWDNLVPSANGNVYWTVNGAAPNRELVIEWRNMSHFGCKTDGSETVTFEVVFFENSTDLLFNYLNPAFGGTCAASDNGATEGVGVQATSKVAQQFSLKTASLSANSAISWKSTLPQNVAPTVTDLYPKSWVTDINDLYLELTGTRFNFNSVALVNGVPQQTYVFSSTDLVVLVPASDLTNAGTTLQISVFNGSPGGGPSAPIALPINSPDFSLFANSGATMRSGQSATITVFAEPNPAFHAGITLSCSGLPANVICSFDPGRILAPGFGVVTFSSKPTSSAMLRMPVLSSLALCFPLLGMLWIAAAKHGGRNRNWMKMATVLLISVMLVSCGGGGSGGSARTPFSGGGGGGGGSSSGSSPTIGTFSVTITGTSGAIQHSTKVTLTITP